MKLTALCTAKDEWPMIACACLHLLQEGIDEIIVLTSGSSDETSSGLRRLAAGGAPIVVIDEPSGLFHHGVITTMLAHLAMDRGADWLVMFDADEFMLTADPALTVRDVIAAWHDSADGPRARMMEVRNFLVPRSTTAFVPETLEKVMYVAVPVVEESSAESIELVRTGRLPFVCAPFPAKLVLPASEHLWIGAGTHEASGLAAVPIVTSELFIAHVPFRDPAVIGRRAIAGQSLRRLGYAPGFGWQSQLVADAGTSPDAIDRETWWLLNSAPDEGPAPDETQLKRTTRLADRAVRLRSAFGAISELGDDGPHSGSPNAAGVDSAEILRAGIAAARTAECALEEAIVRAQVTSSELHATRERLQHMQADVAALHEALVIDVDYWRARALDAERMRAAIEGSRAWRLVRMLGRCNRFSRNSCAPNMVKRSKTPGA